MEELEPAIDELLLLPPEELPLTEELEPPLLEELEPTTDELLPIEELLPLEELPLTEELELAFKEELLLAIVISDTPQDAVISFIGLSKSKSFLLQEPMLLGS
jgi:hypothetical protein